MKELITFLQENPKSIVIGSNHTFELLMNYQREHNLLLSYYFKTVDQVVEEILGRFSDEVLVKLVLEEGYQVDIAKVILDNLLFIDEKEYQSPKLHTLVNLKRKYKQYLIKNPLFETFYKSHKICLIDYPYINDGFYKIYQTVFPKENIKNFTLESPYQKDLTIYSFNNPKEEVEAFCEEVSKLLAQNVKVENIKVHTLNNNYKILIKNIAKFYNIDCDFPIPTKLNEFTITKEFLHYLEEKFNLKFTNVIEEGLLLLQQKFTDDVSTVIYQKIVNIINRYLFFNGQVCDILPILQFEFNQEYTLPIFHYKNALTMTNIFNENIFENDYVFILGFNQDVFPPVVKDEDFLFDDEKQELNLPTSRIINEIIRNKALTKIASSKSLYLSYPQYSNEGKLTKSSFIDTLSTYYQVKESKYTYIKEESFSKKRHFFYLSKLLDKYFMYDEISSELSQLLFNHQDQISQYNSYTNVFFEIDLKTLQSYLENEFVLSYTSINTFYNCQFRFMLERVLKLTKQTNKRSLMIGTLFHYALEKLLSIETSDFQKDYFAIVNEYCNRHNVSLDAKDQVFIKIYGNYLEQIYPILKKQYEQTFFKVRSVEESFIVSLDDKVYKPILVGKIDKILTYEDQNNRYAIVLDYKTGNNEFDYNKAIHGLDLQTLIYFYLLNNQEERKYGFAGAYLQSILPSNPLRAQNNSLYQELLEKYLTWNGYSINSIEVLSKIDRYVGSNNSFLKGIEIKNDGTLAKRSLDDVISNEEFDALMKLVENKINECLKEVRAGKFPINPKKGSKVNSCMYCPYYDVCFRKEQDYVRIEISNDLSFLRSRDEKHENTDKTN